MVLRTLRVPFNMKTILMVIFTVIIVDASVREKPIQILRTLATAGLIREYQLEDRQSRQTYNPNEETVLSRFQWKDLGAGCCSDRNNNALFKGVVKDLNTCKSKCFDYGAPCGFVEYGWKNKWNDATRWCYVVSDDASCNNLDKGSNDCGSTGNNGVHTFKPMKPVQWVDLGAGCCSDRNNNGLFKDYVKDLNACKNKCLDYEARCGFVEYGWDNVGETFEITGGNTRISWCYVVSDDASCNNLHKGSNDCGSTGNNGVHSYKAMDARIKLA